MLERLVRLAPSAPWTDPGDSITSVVDWIAVGGATPPVFLSAAGVSPPGTVETPDGRVPGVGWSIRLAADWARAGAVAVIRISVIAATVVRPELDI
ncbi:MULTISPECIES: hypothetical protein [unclassified Methylobacterium]|uniref:hypothetical protein n=1 Tax=unclassified Methylobacterium TaxID=2615210 RepID=UPI0037007E95